MGKLENLTITIFGGTGFVGRHLIKELCKEDCRIQVPTRNTAKSYFLQPLGDVNQIVPIECDFEKIETIKSSIEKSDVVINLIGILFEKRKNEFNQVHFDLVKKIVRLCNDKNIKKFIHFSAIGSEKNSESIYSRTKYLAEEYISKNVKNFNIIRPSIIFGPEDNFFNLFAKLTTISPFLPLIMGGKTKFQPVYVEDVSKGVIKILKENKNKGVYDFGGPHLYSFKELMEILLKTLNKKRFLISVPKVLAIQLARFLELFPNPLLTRDQIKLLEKNNIVSDKNLTFKNLKINPVSTEMVIEDYLKRFIKKKSPLN